MFARTLAPLTALLRAEYKFQADLICPLFTSLIPLSVYILATAICTSFSTNTFVSCAVWYLSRSGTKSGAADEFLVASPALNKASTIFLLASKLTDCSPKAAKVLPILLAGSWTRPKYFASASPTRIFCLTIPATLSILSSVLLPAIVAALRLSKSSI